MTLDEMKERTEAYCREHHPNLVDASVSSVARVIAYQLGHVCTLLKRISSGTGYTNEEFLKNAAGAILCTQVLCDKMGISLAGAIEEALKEKHHAN